VTARPAGPFAPEPVRPKLVIFDCDGVLVDSEAIAISVLTETLVRAGASVDEPQAFQRFLGRSMASVVSILERDFAFRFTDAHHGALQSALFERFRAELKPMAGVREVLEQLPCRVCVASSSRPERLRLALEVAGLLSFFEPHLFSAASVARGKPAPDLFLHAAGAMQAPPGETVVVEDSLVGVEAARAAGMRVLAFTGGAHAAPANLHAALSAAGPDALFSRMRDLPRLLGFAPAAAPLSRRRAPTRS
jgi:HAD superfamily hydrolase (TIGR01509 family)